MNILHQSKPRKTYKLDEFTLDDLIVDIKKISSENKIDFISALKVVEVFELRRRNNLTRADHDKKDEQLSGFGEILERIASCMEGYDISNLKY